MAVKEYSPPAPVSVAREIPVAWSTKVTFAVSIAAPVGSETVPRTAPWNVCPHRQEAAVSVNMLITYSLLRMCVSLLVTRKQDRRRRDTPAMANTADE